MQTNAAVAEPMVEKMKKRNEIEMRSIHTIEEPPFAICFCAFYYIICRNSVQYVKEYLTNTQMVGYTENR